MEPIFFFKQKTAYEISECDWSSDVCSSDLDVRYYRILVSTLAGDRVTARGLLLEARGRAQQSDADLKLWDWVERDLGLQQGPS